MLSDWTSLFIKSDTFLWGIDMRFTPGYILNLTILYLGGGNRVEVKLGLVYLKCKYTAPYFLYIGP